MKIIHPSVDYWLETNTLDGIWEHAARCARVCYQSQSVKKGESAKDFLLRTIAKNGFKKDKSSHMSVLEHSTVYLTVNKGLYSNIYRRYNTNPYSKVNAIYSNSRRFISYITTNLRVIIENDWFDDLQFMTNDNSNHIKRYTFSFITNLGVSRELNRHRCHSISEESTRYCNYSKDKFDNGLTFVIPAWSHLKEGVITYDLERDGNPYNRTYYINNEKYDPMFFNDKHSFQFKNDFLWLVANKEAESSYLALLKRGQKPQQAREVLPLSLKTQVVHTAFEDDWKDFIALRSDGISGVPHPNIKVLADKVKEFIYG